MRYSCLAALMACAIPGSLLAAGTTALAPTANPDIFTNSVTVAHDFHAGAFDGPLAFDNLISANNSPADTGLIFFGSDTFNPGPPLNTTNPQRMAITGFNSAITELWFHTLISDIQRVPALVTIKSSTTSQTSLNAADYPTTLATSAPLGFAAFSNVPAVVDPIGDPAYFSARYAVLSISAPAGTQSLFLDFQETNMSGGNGARIQELQAFNIPEPGSVALMLCGAAALMLRKRS